MLHLLPILLALPQLLLQAFDFFARLRDAARDAEFIDEKYGPDYHPRRKEEFEVLHCPPFAARGLRRLLTRRLMHRARAIRFQILVRRLHCAAAPDGSGLPAPISLRKRWLGGKGVGPCSWWGRGPSLGRLRSRVEDAACATNDSLDRPAEYRATRRLQKWRKGMLSFRDLRASRAGANTR